MNENNIKYKFFSFIIYLIKLITFQILNFNIYLLMFKWSMFIS